MPRSAATPGFETVLWATASTIVVGGALAVLLPRRARPEDGPACPGA